MEANVVINGVAYNYHVTKDGRVFSLNYNHTGKIKELKYNIPKTGYRFVCLHKNGKQITVGIARLVAFAYIPNPEGKPTVDHINRIRTDDRVENLRWATQSEQIANQKHPKNATKSKPVKCVETGIVYPSAMEIKRQLGLDNTHICDCCNGKRKTANGYHWQFVNE